MADPMGDNFGALVRALHQYIKAYHHRGNIQLSKGDTVGPPGLARITKQLEVLVKPAMPTPNTESMLYGNARNWLHNSLQILEDHYQLAVNNSVQRIRELQLTRWQEAWSVAMKWARRNLKKNQRWHPHGGLYTPLEGIRTHRGGEGSSAKGDEPTTPYFPS